MFIYTLDSNNPDFIKKSLQELANTGVVESNCIGSNTQGAQFEFEILKQQAFVAMAAFLHFNKDGNTLANPNKKEENKIKWIICIIEGAGTLQSPNRHWAFRLTRCSDGAMMESRINSGGESNIWTGCRKAGIDSNNCYYYTKPMKYREFIAYTKSFPVVDGAPKTFGDNIISYFNNVDTLNKGA